MSDTPEDIAAYALADKVRINRAAFPCEKFTVERFGKRWLDLYCDVCLWDFDAHVDRDHENALEMDSERDADIDHV